MKHNLIIIRALRADDKPSPSPELIADLVEGVFRVPGLRVRSVEVLDNVDVGVSVSRRIREVKSPREAAKRVQEVQHVFAGTGIFCKACGREKEHPIHV